MEMNHLLFTKYIIQSQIGNGSFGSVFKAIKTNDSKKENPDSYAIKLEINSSTSPMLEKEALILKKLNGKKGFPKFHEYLSNSYHSCLVMSHLDKSISDLKLIHKIDKFSNNTVANIGIQILKRLETLHKKGLVHGDIKPENMMIGFEKEKSTIYLVDFGLSSEFREGKKHKPPKIEMVIRGTKDFMSLYTHERQSASRKNDIESLAYSLIFLSRGRLPWSDEKDEFIFSEESDDNLKDFQDVRHLKKYMPLESICLGACPEILEFLKYARNLSFEECPNYKYLIKLLKKMLVSKYFDWEIPVQSIKLTSLEVIVDKECDKKHSYPSLDFSTLATNGIGNLSLTDVPK